MKRMPKKLVWTLGIIFGLVLVTVVGLRLFLPVEKVKELAIEMAAEKLGREISVGDVGVSFAGGLGVVLDQVQVANPADFAGEPFFMARQIDLKLQISPLLHGEIQVHRLVVDNPRIRLVRQLDGTNNFTFEQPETDAAPGEAGGPDSEGEKSGMAISFDRLQLRKGHLTYHDEESGMGLTMAGVHLTGGLTNPGPGIFKSSGLLKADSLLVEGDKPLPALAAAVDYDFSFDANQRILDLTRGDLVVNGMPIGLHGQMIIQPENLLAAGDLKVEHIDLNDLLVFLTPEQIKPLENITIAGNLSVDAGFDFDRSRDIPLGYVGKCNIAGLRVASPEFEGDLYATGVGLEIRPDDLKMKTEGATFSNQPFDLALELKNFQDPAVTAAVSGAMDLSILEPYLPTERGADLSGLCELDGTFGGRIADPENMDFKGRAVFANVTYLDASLPDTLKQLDGTVRFSRDSLQVEKMDARFTAGDISLTGILEDYLPYFLPSNKDHREGLAKPLFTFDATSQRIDIDKLFPAATPGSGSVGEAAPPVSVSVAAEPMPDFLCQGTILADTLIYSQVPFTRVAGKVRLKDRILECYDVTAGVYGGIAGGQVAIDLNDLNDPAYSGQYEAAEVEADNFLTRFTSLSEVLYGKAALAGSFTARGREPDKIKNTLSLDSTASLTSGKVMTGDFLDSSLGALAGKLGQTLDKEQALKDLSTLIKVENGRVGLDNLTTRLGNFGDLSLGGSYGFAGDLEYRGSILLSKDQTARLYASGGLVGSIAGLFGDKSERLSLPITIDGTMTKPRMDIDYTELTNNLQNQLSDDLKDDLGSKLKGLFGK